VTIKKKLPNNWEFLFWYGNRSLVYAFVTTPSKVVTDFLFLLRPTSGCSVAAIERGEVEILLESDPFCVLVELDSS
jgi:hypothetical protein